MHFWSTWLMYAMALSPWKLGTFLNSSIVNKKISSSVCDLVMMYWCSSLHWFAYYSLRIKLDFFLKEVYV